MTITEEQEFTLFRLRHDRFRRTRAISTQGPGKILKTKKACYDHELLAQCNFKCGICGKGFFGSRASWKCIRKELRKHLAVGPPLLLECAVSGNTVF
ncbi:hypothetical protein T4D_9129 [Trichinella pseudospiralis]|uniref:Uncharacterized protein n=1 Tax=Trichinella pseudospiralis TaxID=6337 RepID=A0A0V1F4I4_TRIPS|nr:hypothetical protein T4D_9129 [Trichinella pseudospiralis]